MNILKPIKSVAGKVMCKNSDGTRGDKASPVLAKQRFNICKKCEFLFTPTMQCKKCLCFVEEKSKCKPERCPAGRW
jgi:hypothetical protein